MTRSSPVVTRARSTPDIGPLFDRIVSILEDAGAQVVRSVNSAMVLAYWHVGRELVEYYQGGTVRAEYGDQLLEVLSSQLQEKVGRGYSVTNLRYFRLFYQTYREREPAIRHKPCDELPPRPGKHHKPRDVSAAVQRAVRAERGLDGFSDQLSWSHYRTLTKVDHPAARAFYEIEAERENWSVPHLERQTHTQLFARLLKSRDKAGVMDLASRQRQR